MFRSTNRGTLLLGASLLALGALAPHATAQTVPQPTPVPTTQDEPFDDLGEPGATGAVTSGIVVTGIRASLGSAQAIKRNSDQMVDSIVAVDIGKLPDVNVAESLQRISGVQITRNRGEGSAVAIRGLTQVRTEINGRDSFSATDGRALSFEDVPSELLAGIDVYKNPSARLIEGGIGGTINLRTRMPFDAPGPVVSASVTGTHYDLRDKNGYAVSGLVSNRWNTGIGEIGVLVNLSYSKAYFREDALIVEPFWARDNIPGFEGQEVFVASGGGASSWRGDRARFGAAGAVQWAPTDNLEFYVQGLYSDYAFQDPQTGMFGYGPGETAGSSLVGVPGSFTFDDEGNMVTGAFSGGISFQTFTRNPIRDSYTADIAGGFKWNVTDRFELSADVQYVDSGTKFDDVTGFGALNSSPVLTMDLSGDIPELAVSDPAFLTDPANYNYQAMMVRQARNSGNQKAARLDAEWDFEDDGGFLRSLSGGVRVTSRDVETRDTGFDWSAISGPPWDGSADATALYTEFPEYYAPEPVTDLFRGDAIAWGPHFIVSPELMEDRERAIEVLGGLNPLSGSPTTWTPLDELNDQHEATYSAYAQVDFGYDTFFLPFDGNIGLRMVNTTVEATGTRTLQYRLPTDTTTIIQLQEPNIGEQEYTNFLPSLNLRFFLQDDLFWRVAASRGLSRPSFYDLRANFSLSENYTDVDNDPTTPPVLDDRTGSGGNPLLEPLTVTQFDTAIEWYPRPTTTLYGTLFYKKVKNFIQNGVYFQDYPVPGIGEQRFEITGPVNGEEGTIKGFEVGGNTFFDFLPAPFDGLGIQANYTFVDSEAPSPSATDTSGNPLIVPLEFLSKHSYNLIGLYEKGPVTARLAYNWRDRYVVTTAGNGTGSLPIYNTAFGQLDASLGYDVTEQFSVQLDAVNLLDTQRETFQAFATRPRDFILNDRRFSIRLRYVM